MSTVNGTGMRSFQNTGASSYDYKVVSSVFMWILIFFIIFGNILAVIVYCKSFRLRAVTRIFIVNLAVTDLLVGTVCMPFWFHRMLLEYQNVNTILYRTWVTLEITCATASISSLAILAVDRYIIITKPFLYERLLPKSRAPLIVFLIWLYSLVLALLRELKWKGYAILTTAFSFVLPVAIMIFAYVNIFQVARFQAHRIRRSSVPNDQQSRSHAKRFGKELKAAKTISLVIGAFLVCWLPFFLVTWLAQFCRSCGITFDIVIIVKWLHYANSAINPVIYAMHNRDFREALRTTWKNSKSREPDLTPRYSAVARTTERSI